MHAAMPLTMQEEQSLLQEGAEALGQGRAGDARARLERLTAAGSTNPQAWLYLAVSCRFGLDLAAEEAALNRLLQLQPYSILGNVMKGDCRAASGDEGAAIYFYKAGLRYAAGVDLPANEAAEVQRAEQALTELNDKAFARREALLTRRGMPPATWSPRLRHALDLAADRRKLYLQQPTIFHYPELPHIQYFDPAQFDWVAEIEAATGAIRDELLALLQQDGTGDFRAYIQSGAESVRLDATRSLVDDKDWSALFLVENGAAVAKVVDRCPRTWEAIQRAPLLDIPGRGPTAMFSLLKAGARIAPHTGMFNTRLVCHLPLIVPPGCRFRVGNDVREWEEGKLMIFDDTIEHEAWNDSQEDRVVLIFDIWRPELSEREREELTALLSA
jgi:aspartyl/asparaginyl beta-hydroxylase (cupin superfamily)